MEKQSISYFRELLARHIKEFKDHCTLWENIVSTETVPEEVSDEIRVTIGLTNLLMNQKMKQFGELIDDSEQKRGEKEITCEDLQGFWDMVYNEVEKIQKSFKKLKMCQNNNWVFIKEPISKKEPKKKPAPVISAQVISTAKERAVAARRRLAEAKLKMKAQQVMNNADITEEPVTSKAKNTAQVCMEIENVNKIEDAVKSSTPRKQTKSLKVIENVQVSEQKASASKKKNKENSVSVPEKKPSKSLRASNEKASSDEPAVFKRSSKEVIPLQCLTRSAKKALLAKENIAQTGE